MAALCETGKGLVIRLCDVSRKVCGVGEVLEVQISFTPGELVYGEVSAGAQRPLYACDHLIVIQASSRFRTDLAIGA